MPRTVNPVIADGAMSSSVQPSIPVDDTLSLRPFTGADAPSVLQAFSDPDIQLWHGFRVDSIEQAQTWIDTTHELWSTDKSAVWAMTNTTDQVLGRCALHIDCFHGTAEIAYWVLPDARRQNVAVRATVAVTEWAHRSIGVHRILLQHSTRNHASCAVAQRAGYQAEGTARQQGLHTDGWHDMHQHAHLIHD